MSNYKIAVIGGDGIGPEVVAEGLKVLNAASKKHGFTLETTNFDFGGTRYLKTKEILSDEDVDKLRQFDSIYLGGIGHPDVKPGILEKGILLKLRFDLDQYINFRPVKLYPGVKTPLKGKSSEDIDYVVFRENTGGLYTGIGEFQNKGTKDEVAIQCMEYSYKQVERCIRYAFETLKLKHENAPWPGLSRKERESGKIAKLTFCGKTNVLTYVFDLWQRVFDEVAKDFSDIIADYCHVDAICIYMVEDPKRFNGIVTSNMFGDIITDLAAATQGGMGVASSGNINPNGVGMFEPVHGTAPSFAGKGVVNPIAAILTAALMLRTIGELDAGEHIEKAVGKTTEKMNSMLVGEMGYTTAEIGDMVVENL